MSVPVDKKSFFSTQTGATKEKHTVESLKAFHHNMIEIIVNDDDLFQELKQRMRNSRMVTNAGVAVALHHTILNSMQAVVECKLSETKAN